MYTKLELSNGTILNSQHLNHIEDGIFENSRAVEKSVAVSLEASYDEGNHILTIDVLNSLGELISGSTIDMPTEFAIESIDDIIKDGKKYLRFTTINGETFDVEMDKIFADLIDQNTFTNAINQINSSVENINSKVKTLESDNKKIHKRLANLESATLDFIEDSTVAYQKIVPENALPYAKVQKIGGMTRKCANYATNSVESTRSEYGITAIFTKNSSSFIVNGTATTDYAIQTIRDFTLPIGTYTASVVGLNTSDRLYIANSDGTILQNYIETNKPKTFNVTKAGKHFVQFIFANGSSYSNKEIQIMINSGSTALPYEPYFEGLRSAPVTELVSVGANLFDYNSFITNNRSAIIKVIPNRTIYRNAEIGYSSSWQIYNSNDVLIGTFESLGFTSSKPLTLPSDADYIKTTDNGAAANLYIGYDSDTTYRPYFKRTFPISKSIQAIDGYGQGNPDNADEYNYIDYDKKIFYQFGNIVNNAWVTNQKEIDLSAILIDDNYIEVEGGGTITAVNEYNFAVPTTIDYVTDIGE